MTGCELESKADTSQQFHVLLVDDHEDVRKEIIDELEGAECLVFHEQDSVESLHGMQSVDAFDICVLDVRFADGRVQIRELLDLVEQRWPTAGVIILSDFTPEVDESDRQRVAQVIEKPLFRVEPSVLRRAFQHALAQTGRQKTTAGIRFSAYVQDLQRPLQEDTEVDLFTLHGYVEEIRAPFVEVIVEGSDQSELVGRRFLMTYEVFKAIGITGQGMRFLYRVYRRANKIISEVVPPTEEEQSPTKDTTKLPDYVIRLAKLQDDARHKRT